METEVKQRNQRNRRRERAQRMQAQRESKVKDGDSGEDESPAREKPPRPSVRRKRSKDQIGEEDIIDGFAIMAFRTYEDLEVSTAPAAPLHETGTVKPAATAGWSMHDNNKNLGKNIVSISSVSALVYTLLTSNRTFLEPIYFYVRNTYLRFLTIL